MPILKSMPLQLHIGKWGRLPRFEDLYIDYMEGLNYGRRWKPNAGFWTSTFNKNSPDKSDWVRWVKSEMPSWLGPAYLVYPERNLQVLSIEQVKDLKFMINEGLAFYNAKKFDKPFINFTRNYEFDWNKIAYNYDGFHVSSRMIYYMIDFDVESTVWFKKKFKKMVKYTGSL